MILYDTLYYSILRTRLDSTLSEKQSGTKLCRRHGQFWTVSFPLVASPIINVILWHPVVMDPGAKGIDALGETPVWARQCECRRAKASKVETSATMTALFFPTSLLELPFLQKSPG